MEMLTKNEVYYMGELSMELGPKELQHIGDYIRLHIPEWYPAVNTDRQIDLVERIVRVEEELKSQRELMIQGFNAMDKRFESNDKRFDDVNKRFDDVNKRFADMNNRFNSLQWSMGLGFTLIAGLMAVFNFF